MGRGGSAKRMLPLKEVVDERLLGELPLELRQLYLLLPLQTYSYRPIAEMELTVPALVYLLQEHGQPTNYEFAWKNGFVFSPKVWDDFRPLLNSNLFVFAPRTGTDPMGMQVDPTEFITWLGETHAKVKPNEDTRRAASLGTVLREVTSSEKNVIDLARLRMAQKCVGSGSDHTRVNEYLATLGLHLVLPEMELTNLIGQLQELGLSI